MKFELKPAPSGAATGNGWSLELVGSVDDPQYLKLTSKYGVLEFGQRPEGYIGWVFRETGGGGGFLLPFCRLNDDILIGLLLENRPNISEDPVLSLIGGFVDPGEAHGDAMVRETKEETSIDATTASKLPGVPGVSNRLFFVADVKNGQGLNNFALEVPPSALEQSGDAWIFRSDVEVKNVKKAGQVRFIRWQQAITDCPDVFVGRAVAQLLIKLDYGKK